MIGIMTIMDTVMMVIKIWPVLKHKPLPAVCNMHTGTAFVECTVIPSCTASGICSTKLAFPLKTKLMYHVGFNDEIVLAVTQDHGYVAQACSNPEAFNYISFPLKNRAVKQDHTVSHVM